MTKPNATNDTDQTNKSKASRNTTPPAPVPLQHRALNPREYDTDAIDAFLSMVFHSELRKGENILAWKVKSGGHPAYPMADGLLLDILDKTKNPCALYYGTSTCHPDPTDDRLYNRKALFDRLHVVVLDDIGTKIPESKLPKDLIPSYKLESSEGNFQYGYVLTEPVDDLAQAEALIQLIYEAGVSDEGGKMPTKLVRLPEGVNGKAGAKQGFVSRLTFTSGKTWTPQELLTTLGLPIKWDNVVEEATKYAKAKANTGAGTSLWAPVKATAISTGGLIDPVMEWLYASDQVMQDNGQWLTVRCPWADAHSSGDSTAGYLPVGRGDKPNSRAFKCFHEHCAANKTIDFLSYVATVGGPEAGVTDHAADLVSRWAYDVTADGVWDIKAEDHPLMIPLKGFTNMHPHSIIVPTAEGKMLKIKETVLWQMAKAKLNVYGSMFAPNDTGRVVEVAGRHYVNSFAPPDWGQGDIKPHHVRMFTEFMDYLIPAEAEREYFLNWLGAKVQDMGFRGAAIVMVATQQGVGRSTLMSMISRLLTSYNTCNMAFDKLIGDSEFNEWLEKPLVFCDETLNLGGSSYYAAYEKMKDFIDPLPKRMMINPKYGRKREVMIHSSYIFMSNHKNAIAYPKGDRRLFVLRNAQTPAAPEYFTRLNAWLDKDDWMASVFRWLEQRDVNMEKLLSPPPMTDAKREMLEETTNPLAATLTAMLNCWPHEYITAPQAQAVLLSVATRIRLYDMKNWEGVFRKLFRSATSGYPATVRLKMAGTTVRPRIIDARFSTATSANPIDLEMDKPTWESMKFLVRETDTDKVTAALNEELDLLDL